MLKSLEWINIAGIVLNLCFKYSKELRQWHNDYP